MLKLITMDLSMLRTELSEDTASQPESGLDRALRYVKGGAGIALGAVAIIEGLRSLKPAAEGFRSRGGETPDRLSATQALLFSASDVVRGLIDTRKHVRTLKG